MCVRARVSMHTVISTLYTILTAPCLTPLQRSVYGRGVKIALLTSAVRVSPKGRSHYLRPCRVQEASTILCRELLWESMSNEHRVSLTPSSLHAWLAVCPFLPTDFRSSIHRARSCTSHCPALQAGFLKLFASSLVHSFPHAFQPALHRPTVRGNWEHKLRSPAMACRWCWLLDMFTWHMTKLMTGPGPGDISLSEPSEQFSVESFYEHRKTEVCSPTLRKSRGLAAKS